MAPDRWQQISRIYHDALARPLHQQDEFVREASAGDSDLEREVRSLLGHSSGTGLDVSLDPGHDSRHPASPVLTGRLGRFELRGLLGSGGMGDVYRAHDDSLGRDVALKLLPRAFTTDPDRLARFEREARILAALNHPHIGAIYGVDVIPPETGIDGSQRALVLELVEGETLAERLGRRPLPLAEVLELAGQMADALEAAHEKGIVHRDLKPSNIKIRPDGAIKVLDFGLAKPLGLSAGQTADTPARAADTAVGLVVGTPAYMSPEQARGLAVDKRADIWAFGCVVYEMLAGHPVFAGDTISDTIAAVLDREPDLTALPPGTPPSVRRLIQRCLVKDSRHRLRDIGDAKADLETSSEALAPLAAGRRWWTMRSLPWMMATVALAVAAWLGFERLFREGGRTGEALERVTYESGLAITPAMSPDGRLVAYASDRAGRGDLDIWVQQIGGGTPLRITEDPSDDHSPDFSPDGKQIVFTSTRAGGGVYLVPALGGPQRLVVAGGRRPRFSPDGSRLTYWTGQFRGITTELAASLFVVALDGGTPTRVAAGFAVAQDAVWSPDGRSLLFLGRSDRARPVPQTFDWWWAPLDGRPPIKTGAFTSGVLAETVTFQGVGSPAAWTRRGVLFTARDNLWRMPVSLEGRPLAAAERLTSVTGRVERPSVGPDGSVVFSVTHSQRQIERVRLDSGGADQPPTRIYGDNRSIAMRASTTADGALIVFEQRFERYYEIWALDTRTHRQQMVLRVPSMLPLSPTVSQDGARIAYEVSRDGATTDAEGYVVEIAGGVPRPICDRCEVYGFLSDHNNVLAVWNQGRALGAIDVRDGSRAVLVGEESGWFDRPHASSDDRWLAFRYGDQANPQIYLTRLDSRQPSPRAEWQLIEQPTRTGRPCGWSLDSTTLYTFLDSDGFRCIWGQRVDPVSGRLKGAVFPVRHFHSQMEDTGPSTSMGNPVTGDGFLYERVAMTGDIWRLPSPRASR